MFQIMAPKDVINIDCQWTHPAIRLVTKDLTVERRFANLQHNSLHNTRPVSVGFCRLSRPGGLFFSKAWIEKAMSALTGNQLDRAILSPHAAIPDASIICSAEIIPIARVRGRYERNGVDECRCDAL